MATRRGTQSFDIYQDPLPITGSEISFDSQTYTVAQNPLSDISQNHGNPQNSAFSTSSVIPPPQQSHFLTDSPQKKQLLLESTLYSSLTNALSGPAVSFSELTQFDKENLFISNNGDTTHKSLHYDSLKIQPHTTSEPDQSGNRQTAKKQKKSDAPSNQPVQIPDHDSWPAIEDDGNKPPVSYSQLIAMAILRSPKRKLTLANIYKFITDSYAYYRTEGTGWQNSIRHNLSLNKAFIKITRAKDDPGKGHYWGIEPGSEMMFLKEPKKPPTYNPGLSSHKKRPSTSQSTSSQTASKNVDSSKFPDDTELSSDATIPASDPAIHDGVAADTSLMPPPSKVLRSSPPPAEVHSSPPAIHVSMTREATPPIVHDFAIPKTLSGGNRKRKHSLLGDSGYYSSIESSATRNPRVCLTSDADLEHPMLKRGRAEEELARIRGSSYDSPSKPRSNSATISSSPFRSIGSKAPWTPGAIFKKPARPPMSVSPNTSLLEHRKVVRNLLGSPDKSLGVMQSPAGVNNLGLLAVDYSAWTEASPAHDELTWDNFINFTSPLRDSPLRRNSSSKGEPSLKRPRLGRANTTASILADITGHQPHSNLSHVPSLSPSKSLRSPPPFFSPKKRPYNNAEATREYSNDFIPTPKFLQKTLLETLLENTQAEENSEDYSFALNIPSDDSEGGVDILQGFQRIGAQAAPSLSSNAPHLAPPTVAYGSFLHQSPTRPARTNAPVRPSMGKLGRRSTSMF